MKRNVFMLLGVCVMMFACSPSTQIVKKWKDPSFTPENYEPFKKVLVIAHINNETSNRIAEDKIVESMKTPAVQAYSILTPADTSKLAIDEKLQKNGIDGLLVMHVTSVNKSLNYQPPTYYGGFYGYRGFYGYGYSSPGYVTEDQTYYVETSIYSVKSNKMIWSATTSSFNPTQLDKTLEDIISAIKMELANEGFISTDTGTN